MVVLFANSNRFKSRTGTLRFFPILCGTFIVRKILYVFGGFTIIIQRERCVKLQYFFIRFSFDKKKSFKQGTLLSPKS